MTTAIPASLPRLDTATALANLGDDPALYAQVVEMFIEDSNTQLDALAAALAGSDLADARRAAHTIKGTAAAVGAERVRHCAYALENACAEGQITDIPVVDTALRAEIATTITDLRAYLAANS